MAFWVLSAASALLLAGLAIYLWVRRPPAPIWPGIFKCQVYALLWVVGDLWATHAGNMREKQIALAVLFTGSIPIAAAWWSLVRRYVASHGLDRPWMQGRWAELPTYYAGIAWLFMLANPWHGQFITPVLGGRNGYEWGLASVFYANYALGLASLALLAWAARRHSAPDTRRKMALLGLASLAPMLSNGLHVAIAGAPSVDSVAIGLGVASVVILFGIFRNRLFSVMPVALPQLLRRDPVGLLLLDRGGRLLMWNPAAERLLAGVDLEPDLWLMRALARRLTSAGDGERLRSSQALTRILTGRAGAAERHVFRYSGADEERWLQLSVVPVPSRRGRLVAVCLRVEDVTALERAERERRALADQVCRIEKLESLGVMAGGVAHDFNNLLTAIGGNARLALDDLPEDAPGRRHLEEVLDAAGLAEELTHQLLTYAGRARAKLEPVDLSALAADMTRLLESTLPSGVTLRNGLEPELPAVEGDPTQLRQILLNLVTNAAEAIGDEPGFITIRTDRVQLDAGRLRREGLAGRLAPGSYVLLEVSDSGCGMDEETRRSIFDPFFTTKRRGRGLGLAAAFGMVRAHRGEISVESESGRGTSFRVWLPVSPLPLRDRQPAMPDRILEPGWRGEGLLLVVDDEARIRRLARLILQRAGFDVLTAGSVDEAIFLFRANRQRIRLVLVDLTMPERGGEEALSGILAIDPDARVLLSSGFDETDAMSRVASQKPGGFLRKPYRPEELVAKVRQLLES